MHAVASTPAEPPGPCHSSAWGRPGDRTAAAFPIASPGRLPHQLFRGLNGVHLRYGLHARGAAEQPFPSGASAVWSPARLSRLLPGAMTISRAGLSPAGLQHPFHGARRESFGASPVRDSHPFPAAPMCPQPFPREVRLHVASADVEADTNEPNRNDYLTTIAAGAFPHCWMIRPAAVAASPAASRSGLADAQAPPAQGGSLSAASAKTGLR